MAHREAAASDAPDAAAVAVEDPLPPNTGSDINSEDLAAALLNTAYKLQWQWCEYKDWVSWCDYTRQQNEKIERAWQTDETTVSVDDDDWPARWVVDLVSLVQKAIEADSRRAVRRVLITHR